MLNFLSSYGGTIIVALIIIGIVSAIIIKMIKDKKSGKSSCGCNCGCCPNSSACHGHMKIDGKGVK